MRILRTLPYLFLEQAGGEGAGGGGANGSTNDGGNTPDPAKELETLKATLANEQKAKLKLQSDLGKLSGELDQIKKSGLKGSENFKQLAETYEAENKTLKTENESLKSNFHHTLRVGAVKEAAMKLGLRNEALKDLEFMEMDTLEIDTKESGVMEVKGVDSWAGDLKKIRPHWFNQGKAPVVNTGGGGAGNTPVITGEITQKDYQEAFKNRVKDPKRWETVRVAFHKQAVDKRKAK